MSASHRYLPRVRAFHVTSSLNRASIIQHGLDWDRMAASRGIAGSRAPELAGVYLCQDEGEVNWFVRMNNTGHPVDVWVVDDVDSEQLIDNESGHSYVTERVPANRLTLLHRDIPPPQDPH